MPSQPIAIIGGGVIGLSVGWHLTRLGAEVCLFEKGAVGCEASSAAAGMITPVSEVRFGEEELLQLFLESLRSYPAFIKEIESASGLSTDFRTDGSLMVAIDHDDEAELNRLFEYQRELGLAVERLGPSQITELEPCLTHQCVAGISSREECFLDNIRLIAALKGAFLKGGGKLFEHRQVDAVKIEGQKLKAIRVTPSPSRGESEEWLTISQVVLATGIHTRIEGLPDEMILPIRPVKGQALEVKNSQLIPLTRAVRTIHRYPVYLVPRSDGRIVVGATSEEMGLDKRVTAGAILDLLFGAWKVLPAIYDMELLNTWTGHRPTSVDHSPILGRTDVDGLFVAMGMYRHGILLTPVVGKLMAELIAKDKGSKFLETFGCKRFSGMEMSNVKFQSSKE